MVPLDKTLLGFIIYFYGLAVEQRETYIKDQLTIIAGALQRIVEEKQLIESFNEILDDVQRKYDAF